MYKYHMEHVCSYSANLGAEPEVIGPVAEGIRLNYSITGGTVSGPKLLGKIRTLGGDWLTIRTDGVAVLDVRGTMELDDGALIYIHYNGVGDLGEDGYERFLAGNLPATMQLRTAPRLQCSHPDYAWVNRLQFVNIGEVDFARSVVSYDMYGLY